MSCGLHWGHSGPFAGNRTGRKEHRWLGVLILVRFSLLCFHFTPRPKFSSRCRHSKLEWGGWVRRAVVAMLLRVVKMPGPVVLAREGLKAPGGSRKSLLLLCPVLRAPAALTPGSQPGCRCSKLLLLRGSSLASCSWNVGGCKPETVPKSGR